MKEGAKFLAGLALAAVLLWLVLRGVEPGAMWAALGEASIVGVLVGGALNLGHNVFRVWRWQALLAPIRRGIGFRPMFVAVVLGYMASWVVPGRLGEVVRPTLLSAREDLPLGPCLGSVVADRLLDGGAIVALFAVGTWLSPLSGPAAEHVALIRSASIAFVAALAAFLAVLLVASSSSERLHARIGSGGGVVRRLGRMFLSLADGVGALRSPGLMAVIVGHSLLAWLTIALGTWIGVRAAGAELSFPAMLVVLPMLALGVAVPLPGGAGSYHAAMKFGLMLFGVSEIEAISAGLLLHAVIVLPVIALGLVLIRTDRVSWKDVLGAARQIRAFGSAAERAEPVEEAS